MEDRTDQERSNANMNSLVENQVNADAPLLAKLDEIRSLLAQSGRADAMTKCDELRALVTPPAVPVRDKDIGDAAGDQALDGWAGAAARGLDGVGAGDMAGASAAGDSTAREPAWAAGRVAGPGVAGPGVAGAACAARSFTGRGGATDAPRTIRPWRCGHSK